MAKRDTVEDRVKEPQRIYTVTELEQFDKSVMKYKVERTLSTGEKVKILDWDEIYVRAGVKTRYETPYVHYAVTWYIGANGQKVFHISEFENKRDQWERWKYGLEKRDEQYARTADEIQADKVYKDW